MQKSIYGVAVGSTMLGLFAAAALWVAGCGGGTGGAGVAPVPPGGGGGGEVDPSVEAWEALFPPGQVGAATVPNDIVTCNTEGCHSGAKHTTKAFADSAHGKSGEVGCQSCHGPGGNHVQAPADQKANTILSWPVATNVDADGNVKLGILDPIVCGKCHTQSAGAGLDQYDGWAVSKHAQVLIEGGSCENCHLDTSRLIKYEEGMDFNEGVDPKVITKHTASCLVCHKAHGGSDQPHQVRHKLSQSGTTDGEGGDIGPGTTVDQYTAFNHVCAECHNGRGVDASDAKLQSSTSRAGMHHSNQFNMLIGEGGVDDTSTPGLPAPLKRQTAHASIAEQCVHCHMSDGNHTMTAANQGCSPCHSSGDAATLKQANGRSAIQNEIIEKTEELTRALETWGETNPIDGKGKLSYEYSSYGGPSSANQAKIPVEIKRARHNLHYVEEDRSWGVHNIAYTRYLLEIGMQQVASAPAASLSIGTAKSASASKKPAGATAASSSSAAGKGKWADGLKKKLPKALRK